MYVADFELSELRINHLPPVHAYTLNIGGFFV